MASFWIEFEQGGELHKATFESESISIGRDRSSDFILDHPTVSRQHALIVHQGGGAFQLVVLSRGGLTAVEGQPATSQEVDLYDGTMITLGQHTFRFRSQMAMQKPGGGLAQPASGIQSGADGVADPKTEQLPVKPDGPGIVSWDEIAASSLAEEQAELEEEAESDFDRIRRASGSKKGQETNPVLVGGALLMCVGILAFVFLGNDSDDQRIIQSQQSDSVPVEIEVSCIEASACQRDALRAYERAVALLESRDVETGNLFEGYKRLLEAKALLEEGGIQEFPSEMSEWQQQHDSVRDDLDRMFRDFRMRYHQASTRNRFQEMAQVLNTIEAFFPDRTSRENRWARDKEMEMKSAGIYPGGF